MDSEKTIEEFTYAQKAEILYDKISELFEIKDQKLYLEHYPQQESDKGVSYLWPFSGMFSAVNALGKLPNMKEKYNEMLNDIMIGLEKYRDDIREPGAYQAYPFEFSNEDRFYDDNMWLGLDFLEAYKLTGNKSFLDKTRNIFEFIKSGWSEDLGGGIYWCEQKKNTKNTCSNGPASVLALELYLVTKEKDYMDWAIKIYKWTKGNLQSPEGVYWDNENIDGTLDKDTYTYNSGTMLNAAVLLYQITNEAEYLQEAQRVAKASLNHFAPLRPEGKRFFPDKDPWFTAVLFRGYQALYEVDKNPEYIDTVIDNIDYAWLHSRDKYGLISRDWSGESREDADSKWLLDEVGTVELYARAALLKR